MTDDTFIYITDRHIIQLSNKARNQKGITAENRRPVVCWSLHEQNNKSKKEEENKYSGISIYCFSRE
jgi:hypothetical protein